VLVPSFPPARPSISTRPFSTELVLVREDHGWRRCLDQPYFMYPVHISLSFLYSTTLASALYLLLLRFLNRDYQKCAELVDTISSDVELTEEENQTLQFFSSDLNSIDYHPDADACRLKISLVLMDSPISVPWDLTACMQRYIVKLAHVSANCRLSHDEELILLKHCVCDPADANFLPDVHTVYQVLVNKNRRSMLRAQAAGKHQCAVELPPTPSSRPWMYEWDSAGLDSSDAAVDALLESCQMSNYRYIRCSSPSLTPSRARAACVRAPPLSSSLTSRATAISGRSTGSTTCSNSLGVSTSLGRRLGRGPCSRKCSWSCSTSSQVSLMISAYV
jgi:hypothetical protein